MESAIGIIGKLRGVSGKCRRFESTVIRFTLGFTPINDVSIRIQTGYRAPTMLERPPFAAQVLISLKTYRYVYPVNSVGQLKLLN